MLTTSLALLTSLCLPAQPPSDTPRAATPEAPRAAHADNFQPDPAWKAMGPSLWFDPRDRRMIVRAQVVLREGALEHLLCLKGEKDHESILGTRALATQIHAVLLLTGAKNGHPVRFLPKFEPPAGTPIAITLEWQEGGKTRKADAREWVRDARTRKPLESDWVFAGSEWVRDPVSKQEYYLAEGGDYITVANFGSSILDLPFASSESNADRMFEARTDVIPPIGTGVTMYFRPRPATPPKP